MCSELHYDYVRLAWDAGFTFKDTENKYNFNFNNLALVDVDRVSNERDIATVVKHLPTILSFKLEEGLEKILEPTFIKVFRLSQLAIQYLQFCKKYLDGTVVILKKELHSANQEVNKLSTYLEDLKAENDKLLEKNTDLKETFNVLQQTASFKCTECPKTFFSEEYLEAHFKRRHTTTSSQLQNESEKLQLEIKELKQRLNNTEKYIQYEKTVEKETNEGKGLPNNDLDIERGKGDGFEEKFEGLRNHIESELKDLKDEKFYKRLFDDLVERIHKTNKNFVEKGSGEFGISVLVDSVTQTETSEVPTPLPRKIDSHMIEKKVEDCLLNLESRVNAMCDKFDNKEEKFQKSETEKEKVFPNINRNEKIDIGKNPDLITEERNEDLVVDDTNHTIINHDPNHVDVNKPNIKKYYVQVLPNTLKAKNALKVNNDNEDLRKLSSRNLKSDTFQTFLKGKSKQKSFGQEFLENLDNLSETSDIHEETKNKSETSCLSDSSDSDSTSEDVKKNCSKNFEKVKKSNKQFSAVSSNDVEAANTKKIKQERKDSVQLKSDFIAKNKKNVLESKTIKSFEVDLSAKDDFLRKKKNYNKQKKLNRIRKRDIQALIDLKLKSLGVAPHWNGIPEKSYRQANTILEQQASLFKKNLPSYSKKQEEVLKIISGTIKNLKETSTNKSSTSFEANDVNKSSKQFKNVKTTLENQQSPNKSDLRNKLQDNQSKKKVFFNLSPSDSSSSLLSSTLDDNNKILKFSD